MSEEEIQLSEKQHAEILHQMRIDTAINAIMAAATITTTFIIFLRLYKHIAES